MIEKNKINDQELEQVSGGKHHRQVPLYDGKGRPIVCGTVTGRLSELTGDGLRSLWIAAQKKFDEEYGFVRDEGFYRSASLNPNQQYVTFR